MTENDQKEKPAFHLEPPPIAKNLFIKEGHSIPEYLTSVYSRRYFHPLFSKLFDDDWLVSIGSFFQNGKLTKIVTNEIIEGNDVLQLGIAFGKFEREIAQKMNSNGLYHIEDISAQNIENLKPRISPWVNITVKERDFTLPNNERYDIVVGYFILHELPEVRKRLVLERAISALKPEGKMIFIDYAQPDKFHPLKYPVKMFNRLYEPFAESLWYNEIKDYAPKTNQLIWDKKTFFKNMYQCVIAQRR